jgi:hypothetical protein
LRLAVCWQGVRLEVRVAASRAAYTLQARHSLETMMCDLTWRHAWSIPGHELCCHFADQDSRLERATHCRVLTSQSYCVMSHAVPFRIVLEAGSGDAAANNGDGLDMRRASRHTSAKGVSAAISSHQSG